MPENPWELTYPDQSEISMWCGYTRATLKSEHDISSVPSRTLADAVPWSQRWLVARCSPSPSWPIPVPCRELAGAVRRSRAGQFLFPEPELRNAVPWSRAGWGCSMVARSPILILFPECQLSNAVPQTRTSQFRSPSLCLPILVPCPELVNAGSQA